MKRWLILSSVVLNVVSVVVLMMRLLFPYHREVSIGIYLIGYIPLFIGVWRQRVAVGKFLHRHQHNLIIFSISLIAIILILTLFPLDNFDVLHSDKSLLNVKLHEQQLFIEEYLPRMDVAQQKFLQSVSLDLETASLAQKQAVRDAWSEYIRYVFVMDSVVSDNQYFYQISLLKNKDLHQRSFLLAYSAFMAQYVSSVETVAATQHNPFLASLLNEASENIPKNTYARFIEQIADPRVGAQIHAGYAYLSTINREIAPSLFDSSKMHYRTAGRYLPAIPSLSVGTASTQLERNVFVAWFPLQKSIAEFMGDTKIPLRHGTTLTAADIPLDQMQPGDVMVQRKNWYLSNVGLPGFWKHTAVYLGSINDLDAYFRDVSEELFSVRLEREYPALYSVLSDGNKRTIEAESEGVISFTVDQSLALDYVGVIRPLMNKEEKLESLFQAFSYYGKPYDFNFDFVTDNAIVCSELYYKTYPDNHILREINGRLVLSSNHIVEDYAGGALPFSFVFFVDSTNGLGSEEAFKDSWKREVFP